MKPGWIIFWLLFVAASAAIPAFQMGLHIGYDLGVADTTKETKR